MTGCYTLYSGNMLNDAIFIRFRKAGELGEGGNGRGGRRAAGDVIPEAGGEAGGIFLRAAEERRGRGKAMLDGRGERNYNKWEEILKGNRLLLEMEPGNRLF